MKDLGGGSYSFSDIPPYVKVGKYSSIAREVEFMEPNLDHLCVQNRKCVYTTNWNQQGSPEEATIIGNDTWIGIGVKILYGVKIGSGCIIGAYSVIAKDVPDYAVVVGNPAVIKRYRFTKSQIKKLLKIEWWHWPLEKIGKDEMLDVDYFIKKYEK